MIRPAQIAFALIALPPLPLVAATAKPATKAGVARDWAKTYSVTPQGGFRIGNPNARIVIVEYGSLTCPHCKHFADSAMKPLIQKYVRTGKASYEFRSMILDGVDLAATLVARCNGPAHFFPMAENLYATQPIWKDKVLGLPAEEQQKLQNLPQDQMMLTVAKITGLIPIAAAHGIPPARAEACLKDDAAANKLGEMYQAAIDRGVEGTPTFYVNGKPAAAYDWKTLEPFLKGAGG